MADPQHGLQPGWCTTCQQQLGETGTLVGLFQPPPPPNPHNRHPPDDSHHCRRHKPCCYCCFYCCCCCCCHNPAATAAASTAAACAVATAASTSAAAAASYRRVEPRRSRVRCCVWCRTHWGACQRCWLAVQPGRTVLYRWGLALLGMGQATVSRR